ncbi:MAG TPA: hypothetical protein DD435_11535 [Cyanobacteria bacterium UBA8530]|nr:hypothetical protein [Cyanobacteria bacterium UBA8530]
MGWLDNKLLGPKAPTGKLPVPAKVPEFEVPKLLPKPASPPTKDRSELSSGASGQFAAYDLPEAKEPSRKAEVVPRRELREQTLRTGRGAAAEASARLAPVNSEAPVSEKHEYIYQKGLSETQQKAFRALSSDERDSFCKVYSTVGGDWSEQNEHTQAAAHSLRLLLENGSLDNVDSKGKKLITTLGEACDQQLVPELKAAKLDKNGQLQQLLKQLAYPSAIYQGEGTDTCAPSSVQTIMASTMPGEYARIATELLFKGKAEVGDDEIGRQTIDLSLGEIGKQDNGRSYFSRVIQGSLKDFASQFDEDGEEYGGRGGGSGSFRGNTASGGLTANQINEMYRYVIGNVPTTVQVNQGNSDKVVSKLGQALEAGVFVPAGLNFDGRGHAITIMGFDGKDVTYCDSVDRRTLKMPVDEFKTRAKMVVLPDQFAEGLVRQANDALEDDFSGRGGGSGTGR